MAAGQLCFPVSECPSWERGLFHISTLLSGNKKKKRIAHNLVSLEGLINMDVCSSDHMKGKEKSALDSITMGRFEVLYSVTVRKGNLSNPPLIPSPSICSLNLPIPKNSQPILLNSCWTRSEGVLPLSFTRTQEEQLTYSMKWFSSYSNFFTNSCLNYPKNAQMWSGKWVLASKQKFAAHWAKNRWTCLDASLGLSHWVCQTHSRAAILTAKMEYINHKQSFSLF